MSDNPVVGSARKADPAVEAAQRARAAIAEEWPIQPPHLVMAAREMAKPIRAVYQQLDEYACGPGDYRAGVRTALQYLAPLIFTSEELVQ